MVVLEAPKTSRRRGQLITALGGRGGDPCRASGRAMQRQALDYKESILHLLLTLSLPSIEPFRFPLDRQTSRFIIFLFSPS